MSNLLDKKNNKLLFLFVIGLFTLLFTRDVGEVALSKYIFLLYCAIFFVAANHITILYMMCFLIPLLNGLPSTYITLAMLVITIIKSKRINTKASILMLIFFILEIVCSIWYPSVDYKDIAEYMFILSLFFILLYDDSCKDLKLCIELFFIGVFVFCFIVILSGIKTAPTDWMTLFGKGWFRFGETNSRGGDTMMIRGNSNELAYLSVVGISVGLVTLEWERGVRRVTSLLFIIFIGISGFLSLSRTWILVGVIILMLYILGRMKSIKRMLVPILIILSVSALVVKYLRSNAELLSGIVVRFSDSTINTLGGRTIIYSENIRSFFANTRLIFIGTGVTQYDAVLNIRASIHNMLLQILICYGIVFAIIFLLAIIAPIIRIRGLCRKMVYWLPFISVILFTQTIQFLNPYYLMLPYAFAVYSLKAGSISSLRGGVL